MLTLKLYQDNQINLTTESGEQISLVLSTKEENLAGVKLSFDAPQSVSITRSSRLRKSPKNIRRRHG